MVEVIAWDRAEQKRSQYPSTEAIEAIKALEQSPRVLVKRTSRLRRCIGKTLHGWSPNVSWVGEGA